MCREAVVEELIQRSERLAWAGRFTYMVGLVPRHLGTTLCMLNVDCAGGPCRSAFNCYRYLMVSLHSKFLAKVHKTYLLSAKNGIYCLEIKK